MLCQLVCADRRYQRMNCFNIRELQGNLKRKFFSDLVNISDHREFLDSTMIGLRFRTNNELNIYHDNLAFHNLGITNETKSRSAVLENAYASFSSTGVMSIFNSNVSLSGAYSSLLAWFLTTFTLLTSSLSNLRGLPHSLLALNSFNTPQHIISVTLNNFNFASLSSPSAGVFTSASDTLRPTVASVSFKSNDVSSDSADVYSQLGSSSNFRNNTFTNPIISYDYKCGHYLGI